MPDMPKPVAILTADIHLSHTPPAARSHEPDWYEAMRRQLKWLKSLQQQLSVEYSIPIFVAGDIFHKYNPPAELINFALRELPDNIYAVPGQHDLPFHNIQDIHKSAYWTLVESGKIKNVSHEYPVRIESPVGVIRLQGFPFGTPLTPLKPYDLPAIDIALIHEYCWQRGASYPKASDEQSAESHQNNAKNYDILVFGDNHIPHEDLSKKPAVFNCGGFYRRTIDEVDYRPSVGVLYSDKTIMREYIPVQQDVFVTKQESPVLDSNIADFMRYLSNTTTNPLDVEEIIRHYVRSNNVPEPVQIEISRLLEIAK
jgi:DNA repair exonuclease SbcCD nuclease subunit